jgi:hypothetical protein
MGEERVNIRACELDTADIYLRNNGWDEPATKYDSRLSSGGASSCPIIVTLFLYIVPNSSTRRSVHCISSTSKPGTGS